MGAVYKNQGARLQDSTFAQRLAMAMAADPRRDYEIAAKAEVPGDQLSRWKNGEASPKLDSVARLVTALGISGHWLLTGEGNVHPTDEHDAAVRLDVIGRIVSGELDAEALQRLSTSGAGALRTTRDVQAVVDPEDEQHTPPAASRTRPG